MIIIIIIMIMIIIIILYDNNIKKETRISAKEWHTVSHRSQRGKGRQYEIKWDSKQGGGGGVGKKWESQKKGGEERKGEE